METPPTWTRGLLPLVLALSLVVAACSDGAADGTATTEPADGTATTEPADGPATTEPADGPDTAGFADGEAWFTIDEAGGTVTLLAGADPSRPEEVTVPIVADATWTIDGAAHEFVVFNIGVDQCPVPDSGNPDDIAGFRGVGVDPGGQPLNLNAGAPTLAINTTYEADWSSTTTGHDWFGPAWAVADGEMQAESDSVTVVETGDQVAGTIVVTCR